MPVKSSTSTSVKYRPAFTSHQIEHITSIMQTDASYNLDPASVKTSQSIVKILVPLISKIQNGLIAPSYQLSEKLVKAKEEKDAQYRYENDLMTPQEAEDYENKLLGC